ncbi:hypothetical protein ACLBWX_22275 [Methylobacterium sp. M6A4_1b]
MFVNIYASNKPENIRGIMLWSAIALFVGYQILNVFVPNSEMILYVWILDSATTAVALWIFAADAWAGIWRSMPRPRDFPIVGIWLKVLSAELQSINAIIYRLSGKPDWWLNNELLGGIILLSVVAVVCHVCTPGTVEEDGNPVVPRRNQYALAIGFGIAVFAVGALIASKPVIGPYLERSRPWIGDWWQTGIRLVPGASPT